MKLSIVRLLKMSEVRAVANFVSKKISKVRWRPASKHVVQKPTIFASGSWDDSVRNVTWCNVFTYISISTFTFYGGYKHKCGVNVPNRYSHVLKCTCWRPVTHAQTWAGYSAVYRFRSLAETEYRFQNRFLAPCKPGFYLFRAAWNADAV